MSDQQKRTSIKIADSVSATTGQFTWVGGAGTLSVEATWGGGTVTFQTMTNNGTWLTVGPDTTFTANGIAGFILPVGAQVRLLIATATAVVAYMTPMA